MASFLVRRFGDAIHVQVRDDLLPQGPIVLRRNSCQKIGPSIGRDPTSWGFAACVLRRLAGYKRSKSSLRGSKSY